MSDNITVEVKGLDDLQRAFEGLATKVAKKGLRQALRAGAEPIRKGMSEEAPRKSGLLADHFDVQTKLRRDELAGTAKIGPNSKITYPSGKLAWLVAKFHEFGTRFLAANPFMLRAFETRKREALAAVVEKLKEAVLKK